MDEASGASRPKVHRLPNASVKEREVYVSRAVVILCLALLVAAVPALWSLRPAGSDAPQGEAPVAFSTAAAETIAVVDDQGQVVGQLAKMPAGAEQGVSVNSIAQADQKTGRELLNIISKY